MLGILTGLLLGVALRHDSARRQVQDLLDRVGA